MARQTSRATLLKELDAIQTKLKNLEKGEGERISRIAIKSGLGRLELDEATLMAEFQGMFARFHKEGAAGSEADPAPRAGAKSGSDASPVEA